MRRGPCNHQNNQRHQTILHLHKSWVLQLLLHIPRWKSNWYRYGRQYLRRPLTPVKSMNLFRAHKNPSVTSFWHSFLHGQITATGAPSPHRIDAWSKKGVTDIVTLQRGDEMREDLGKLVVDRGIQWHHLPLSGRQLSRKQDQLTMQQIPQLFEELSQRIDSFSLVVHCAAGMHRTGIFLYLMFRFNGLATAEAMDSISQIRQITAEELTKRTKKNGVLLEKAEAIYQNLMENKSESL